MKVNPLLSTLSSDGLKLTFPILNTPKGGSAVSLFLVFLCFGCLFLTTLLLAEPQCGSWYCIS